MAVQLISTNLEYNLDCKKYIKELKESEYGVCYQKYLRDGFYIFGALCSNKENILHRLRYLTYIICNYNTFFTNMTSDKVEKEQQIRRGRVPTTPLLGK